MVQALLDGRCYKNCPGPHGETRSMPLQETELQTTPAPCPCAMTVGPSCVHDLIGISRIQSEDFLRWAAKHHHFWGEMNKGVPADLQKSFEKSLIKNGDRTNAKKSSQNSGPSLCSTSKNRGNFNGHPQGQTGRDSGTMGEMFLQYSWDLFGEKRQKHDKNWNLTHTHKNESSWVSND